MFESDKVVLKKVSALPTPLKGWIIIRDLSASLRFGRDDKEVLHHMGSLDFALREGETTLWNNMVLYSTNM